MTKLVITADQFETLSRNDKRIVLAHATANSSHSRWVRHTEHTLAIYDRLRTGTYPEVPRVLGLGAE